MLLPLASWRQVCPTMCGLESAREVLVDFTHRIWNSFSLCLSISRDKGCRQICSLILQKTVSFLLELQLPSVIPMAAFPRTKSGKNGKKWEPTPSAMNHFLLPRIDIPQESSCFFHSPVASDSCFHILSRTYSCYMWELILL